jgi:branched-chain amino acid aminotransferase
MVPYMDATTHVMSHALHYGTGVFEGIRAYNNNGHAEIFALNEHVDRMLVSAKALTMKIPYTHKELCEAIIAIVKINQFKECYIRPLAYYGLPPSGVRVMPSLDTPVEVIVSCYNMGNYLADGPIHAKISDIIRLHPKSTNVSAKICGHYINSLQALLEIRGTHYGEVIMLDYEGNVSEGSSDNIFVIKDNIVYTPPLGGILNGITRRVIMELLRDLNCQIVEKIIKPEELYTADEIFVVGTAVEVHALASVNDKKIGTGEEGPITKQVRWNYKNICQHKNAKYTKLLTKVV